MSAEANKVLVRRWTEEHNRRNHLAIDDELVAPDFRANGLPLGLAGEKRYAEATYAAFPDMHATILDILAEGDRVAARVRYAGTHLGEWAHPLLGRTIPPTGRRTAYEGITTLRIADGKIAEQWAARDSLGSLRQLGILPGGADAGADPDDAPTPAIDPADRAAAEGDSQLVRRWYEEAWNGRDLDALDALYAPDWIGHFPQGMELRGVAAHKPIGAAFAAAFPDLRYTVEETVAEGDRVASRYSARGTHRGELRGIAPTGRAVTILGINLHRIAGGRIAEQWAQYDMLGLLHQLGALPAAGEGGR